MLAGATLGGAIAIILGRCVITTAGPGSMFGPQPFILFLPLVLFWAGAWMRRKHGAIKWSLAACLLLFSMAVTLIGATDPCPRDGYVRYTPLEAAGRLFHNQTPAKGTILAGR
jgi:hypothetical protein